MVDQADEIILMSGQFVQYLKSVVHVHVLYICYQSRLTICAEKDIFSSLQDFNA